MKKLIANLLFAACFVVCSSLSAWAQGVHLSPGDTLSFGFNGVDSCHFTEASPGSYVAVAFGDDSLGAGESLRLEMFENSLNDPPFASQTYSPSTSVTSVAMYGPRAWLDFQGVIRIDMLSGSVDVGGGYFIVSPDISTYCNTSVAVPEPSSAALIGLGAVVSGVVLIHRRRRSQDARAA